MLFRWLLAAVHLLAFGLTLASIPGRSWALRRIASPSNVSAILLRDARFFG
jgi:putative membrane protein